MQNAQHDLTPVQNAQHDLTPRYRAALMDQAEYLDRVICNQQIQCVMGLEGVLDEGRLERALRLAMDVEPILGCRFVENARAPYWQRRGDLDELAACSFEECSGADLSGRIMEFLKEPGDPRFDPLVRVQVLRARTDTVCVKVDHIVADTGGTRDFLHLLCDLYHELDGVEHGRAHGDRRLRQVLRNLSARELLSAVRDGNPSAPAWGFPFRGKGSHDWDWAMRRIGPEEFAALKEFGMSRRATINDCILAAYYRAFFEFSEAPRGAKCTIRVPIDLRRYLEDEKAGAVCNLTGQMYPTLERVPGESFAETLARVRDEMNRLKGNRPGIGAAIVVGAFMLPQLFLVSKVYRHMLAHEVRTGRCDPYLSNMGVLSPDRLRFGDVAVRDAYLVSPLQWYPGFLLGASSFKNTLTLTVGYADAHLNAPVIDRFLDMIADDLRLQVSAKLEFDPNEKMSG